MAEISAAVAALFSCLAAIIQVPALSRPLGQQRMVALLLRGGSVLALAVALGLTMVGQGEVSPRDLRQVAFGLALATAAVHLALSLTLRQAGGGWLVDVLPAGLILLALIFVRPGAEPLRCDQRTLAFGVAWALYLFGSGAAVVAGGAGGMVLLDDALGRKDAPASPPPAGRWRFLVTALFLGTVILGGGLLVGACWAWRTTGTLGSGDPRQSWLAAAWLALAMSFVAGESGPDGARWMAFLTFLAALVTIVGLLAVPDLVLLWST